MRSKGGAEATPMGTVRLGLVAGRVGAASAQGGIQQTSTEISERFGRNRLNVVSLSGFAADLGAASPSRKHGARRRRMSGDAGWSDRSLPRRKPTTCLPLQPTREA